MGTVKELSLENNNPNFGDIIIGIDLGTTNSAVAVHNTGLVPTLCPMGPSGKYTLQSCVQWNGGNSFTVGPEAYANRYKPNVCYSVKRIMGTEEKIKLTLPDHPEKSRTFTPVEISAEILKELKRLANESYPGVYKCVITVPAYFSQRQIEDTVSAAKLAKLDCLQIIKEPTSAAYIYSTLGYASDGSIMVYDLGGGTFDVTLMSFLRKSSVSSKVATALKNNYNIDVNDMKSGDSSLYYCRVIGTYGDTRLGGDDIDKEVAKLVIKRSEKKNISVEAREEIILRCEQFKKGSASALDVTVKGDMYHITSEDVNEATKIVYNKTLAILNTIPKAHLDAVKTIVLVGGSTKSDYLVSLLGDTFPSVEISRVLDPDATVALGAGAIAKDLQSGKGTSYQDVLPLAIGILDNETNIDMCIPRNTAMPFSVTRTYHTMYDNQQAISIDVYQGLSNVPEECVYLGRLRVPDLPPKPAGQLNVDVCFMLNAQGRLTVSTRIEGVDTPRELVIDSIFNVTKDESDAGKPQFVDDFEEAIYEFAVDNPDIQALLEERRIALSNNNNDEVDAIEERIMGKIS